MTRRTNLAAILLAAALGGCSQSDATADRRTMSSVEPVTPGDGCPAGGQKILTGVDRNGDGVLQADEVTQVAYVCNDQPSTRCTTLEGSVTIRNTVDWAELVGAGCTKITGMLEIAGPGLPALTGTSPLVEVGSLSVHDNDVLTAFALPSLKTVAGGVAITMNPALARLDLPALERVGGAAYLEAGAASSLSLPSLARIGGDLGVAGDVAHLDLPALAEVGGQVTVGTNALAALTLPRLATAGSINIYCAPQLGDVSLPALTSVGVFQIANDDALATIDAPLLTTVTAYFGITDNPSLTEIHLPSLATLGGSYDTGAYDAIQRNLALTTLDLSALTSVGYLLVDAAQVTTLDLHAVTTIRELLSVGGSRLGTMELPNLTTAGGLGIGGGSLRSVNLPALATVGMGGLSIGVASLEALELPELTTVGGGLGIGSTARRDDPQTPWNEAGTPSVLTRVSLPKLTSVGFELGVTRHPALVALDAPVLASAGGIDVSGNDALARVSFPALTSLVSRLEREVIGFSPTYSTGAVNLLGNASLAAVDLPVLAEAHQVTVQHDPALAALELPALTSAGTAFDVLDVAALTTLSAPHLVTAYKLSVASAPALTFVDLSSYASRGATVTFQNDAALESLSLPAFTEGSSITVSNNASLTTVSLPSLAKLYSWIFVTSNPALTRLGLPALTSLGSGLSVHDNTTLPQCQVDALQAQLNKVFAAGFLIVYGNDTNATCN